MTRQGNILFCFKAKKHGFARGFMAEVTTPWVAVLDECPSATLPETTISPLKKWGWKTEFILGSSYGANVTCCSCGETPNRSAETGCHHFNFSPLQKWSSAVYQHRYSFMASAWSKKVAKTWLGWCWQVPNKKELLHLIPKSLKRHLLLHDFLNRQKKNVALIPMIRQSALMPQSLIETIHGWWISTCPSPVSQILA